ncbi:histidine phosphatase family protein [Halalkalibacterium halodurans]|uniref:BH0736 protein n=2 Tax=Halalkalibacterium halodurans TaxID=86665 RepID=Q9KEW3_HALH5|nr:histidine phosphatase family protein [Halalkalibacterium halodurans]MDY7221241.1 histidine phosphatase family protein [Halalkalibacterium halodurans]MDY7240480.1 histidine phosphatase family protein [Halalkalibacterium halodurans]MED4080362.1 histidine phosphatase family protein [Halalkalibacterium halodurans]MED4084574.1 histidine phosphatase family protein [Halalkalibacterium halodurans]MED4104862.1 histidine phosphatase family protein [Halalkalibacterium halodurans]
MKIGLLRHFKVTRGYPNRLVTSDELMKWVEEYDASEVEANEVDLRGIEWEKCYSSDLPRAIQTAEAVYDGEIERMEALREIRLAPLFRMNVRLPLFVHLLFIRGAWLFNHKSQPEARQEVIVRIRSTLDEIVKEEKDVLIVSHGGVMMFMRKELMRRGFRPQGAAFKRPENGKLYVFEK